MVNEFMSSHVFDALAAQLLEAGFGNQAAEECRAFAEEERTHGVLCGAVVEALGGEAYAEVPSPRTLPRHDDVSPREAALRNVLSVCCLSETVAVSLIGAERLEMEEGPLKELLTRIYADEVGHARFGWSLLAREASNLDEAARHRLGAYLAVAFAHLEAHELSHLPEAFEPPPDGASLGLCSGREGRTLFYETVDDVIVPRLEDLGLPARNAWKVRTAVGAHS